MPHASIHVCCVTNWKPGSPVSNSASIQMLMAPVATLASRAISLTSSGRRLPVTATASAPTTGTRISAVRIGNPTVDACSIRSLPCVPEVGPLDLGRT